MSLPDPDLPKAVGSREWFRIAKGITIYDADGFSIYYMAGYHYGARGMHPSISTAWTPTFRKMWMMGYGDGIYDYEHQPLIERYGL